MEEMTIDYAIRLLQKDTSYNEIAELEYHSDLNHKQVVDKINEAVDLLCEVAKKYQELERVGEIGR